MRSSMRPVCWVCVLVLLAACGGGGQRVDGCTESSQCSNGQVCLASAVDPAQASLPQDGHCEDAPFQFTMESPTAATLMGASGLQVVAALKLASDRATAPDTAFAALVGAPLVTLAQVQRQGDTVRYEGVVPAPPATEAKAAVFAGVKVPGGVLVAPAVAVDVDTRPPDASNLVVDCTAGGCTRTGWVDVVADVRDANPFVIKVSTSLDGFREQQSAGIQGTQAKGRFVFLDRPFDAFEVPVTIRARIEDARGNATTLESAPVTITRLASVFHDGSEALSAPVLAPSSWDGVMAFAHTTGVHAARYGVVWPHGSQVKATEPVAATSGKLWVAGTDGRLHGLSADGDDLAGATCPATAPDYAALYTPAVSVGTSEVVYAAGAAGKLYVMDAATGGCTATTLGLATISSPIVVSGRVFVPTAGWSLRRYSASGAYENWEVLPSGGSESCGDLLGNLAADGPSIIAGCRVSRGRSQLHAIDAFSGADVFIGTLATSASSPPIVLSDHSIVVGDATGGLHRLAANAGSWVEAWTVPNLGSAVTGAAAVTGGQDGAVVYATTAGGGLYALDDGGRIVWSNPHLSAAPLSFPAVIPTTLRPELYVTSADGNLYEVQVDGHLDTNAPWPKAHHDDRNTGNAQAPLP